MSTIEQLKLIQGGVIYSVSDRHILEFVNSKDAIHEIAKQIIDGLASKAVDAIWEQNKDELMKLVTPGELRDAFILKLVEKLVMVDK